MHEAQKGPIGCERGEGDLNAWIDRNQGVVAMLSLTDEEQKWLEEFRRTVQAGFPGVLEELLIFGSKARGDSSADSDLDILVIIADGDWKLKDQITEPGYLSSIGTSVVPSFMVLTRAEWEEHERKEAPFWRTVTRDGVSVQ